MVQLIDPTSDSNKTNKTRTMEISKTLKKKVIACWNNGWCIMNIAYIYKIEPDIVTKILSDTGIKDIKQNQR
jgi:hypothetical protein